MFTSRVARFWVLSLSLAGASHAGAEDWPHWRGSRRNDVVAERSGWSDGEWKLTRSWQRAVGEGSSSPLVVGDRVYTLGWRENKEIVWCLDAATGKDVWNQSYDAPRYGRNSTGDKSIYSAVSSTPEYDPDTKLLYTLGIDGDLNCWNTTSGGKRSWSVNLYDQYRAEQRPDMGGLRGGRSRRDYGYTTAPLVNGKSLIVEVGAKSGTVMGFDKLTGKQLWASDCRDEAGHSGGLVPLTIGDIPCVAVLTLRRLLVVRVDAGHEGKTLAEFDWPTDFGNNIPTPAAYGQSIILTSAYNQYAMARIDISETDGAKLAWKSEIPSGVCSPVVYDGHVYWAWRGIHCVDFATGKQLWQGSNVGTAGSCLVTSDAKLLVWANKGDLMLVETAAASPDKYVEIATRKGLFRRDAWPHIVLANGRLLCRDRDGNMLCFAVGG